MNNKEQFIRRFRQSSMSFTELYAFAKTVKKYDAQNRTHYAVVLSRLMNHPEEEVDEPVPFNADLFKPTRPELALPKPRKKRTVNAAGIQRALKEKRNKQRIIGAGSENVVVRREKKKYSS
jgi:hypothetical protein